MALPQAAAGGQCPLSTVTSFGPWRAGEVTRWLASMAVGLVLVVFGWYHTGGSPFVDTQLAWISLSVAGLLLAAMGNGWWLLSGIRRIRRSRSWFLTNERSSHRHDHQPPSVGIVRGSGLVSAAGMSRYHSPDCLLVAGKATRGATRSEHERRDLEPCGVCRP